MMRTTTMPRKNLDRLLLLVDGSNLAHRAYHKFEGFKDYKGRNCGLVYGFMKILQSYLIRFRPKYLIITFDTHKSKTSNFRNDLLGSYKIHRDKNLRVDVEDFNHQMRILKKLLKYMNVPIVWDSIGLGHESDDYIAYFAKEHSKYHNKVVIISSDKDFCQLIGPDVKIYNPFKETLVLAKTCKDIMGYEPQECVDYLCLLGDKSDDIPGYRGMGEVKTRAFLDEFGSIHKFLKNKKATFRGIDRDGLLDLYTRNKELIDFNEALSKHPFKDIPIKYSKTGKIELEELNKIYKDYNFKSLSTKEFLQPFKKLYLWKDRKNQ